MALVNCIAILVALVMVYRAVDEVMDPLAKSRATEGELMAALGRFLRVIVGSAILALAVAGLIVGRGA